MDSNIINGVDERGEVVEIEEVKKEKAAAETEIEETAGVYLHNFKTPQEYNGKKIESLTLDYNSLTGKSFIQIEKEMTDKGEVALDPLLSKSFQAKLAAKAGKVGTDFIEGLNLSDFYKITSSARNFLVEQA